MWPPIYQCFESHSFLNTEFTGAGEEKCMLNSCSVNTVQVIQGTGPTSLRNRSACIHLLKASNPLQDIATGLYRTNVSVYSKKEFPAMYNPPLPSSMFKIFFYKRVLEFVLAPISTLAFSIFPKNVKNVALYLTWYDYGLPKSDKAKSM